MHSYIWQSIEDPAHRTWKYRPANYMIIGPWHEIDIDYIIINMTIYKYI